VKKSYFHRHEAYLQLPDVGNIVYWTNSTPLALLFFCFLFFKKQVRNSNERNIKIASIKNVSKCLKRLINQ